MVLEIGGVALGLREGVITLIALVAIYMIVVIMRLRRPEPLKKPLAPIEQPAVISPVKREEVPTPPEPEADPEFEVPPQWGASGGIPADELRYRNLENEVFQLRDEVDAVRGELAALRADMLHELAHLRASQTVSPIYGDAMQMAAAGYDPAMIAERCGIARAEAELVVALGKSSNSRENHG